MAVCRKQCASANAVILLDRCAPLNIDGEYTPLLWGAYQRVVPGRYLKYIGATLPVISVIWLYLSTASLFIVDLDIPHNESPHLLSCSLQKSNNSLLVVYFRSIWPRKFRKVVATWKEEVNFHLYAEYLEIDSLHKS